MKVVDVPLIMGGKKGQMERHFRSLFLIKNNCQVIYISWLNFQKYFLLFGYKSTGSSFVPVKVGDKWALSSLLWVA